MQNLWSVDLRLSNERLFDCIYSEISDIFSSQRVYAPGNRTFQSRDEFAMETTTFLIHCREFELVGLMPMHTGAQNCNRGTKAGANGAETREMPLFRELFHKSVSVVNFRVL